MDHVCRVCGRAVEAPARGGPRPKTCPEHRRSGSRGGADPVQRRRNALLAAFGVSLEDYARMLEAQGGVCAGCRRPPEATRALAVDHNHRTGAVRGLLCSGCNLALGGVRDDPETLQRLIGYLARAANSSHGEGD